MSLSKRFISSLREPDDWCVKCQRYVDSWITKTDQVWVEPQGFSDDESSVGHMHSGYKSVRREYCPHCQSSIRKHVRAITLVVPALLLLAGFLVDIDGMEQRSPLRNVFYFVAMIVLCLLCRITLLKLLYHGRPSEEHLQRRQDRKQAARRKRKSKRKNR